MADRHGHGPGSSFSLFGRTESSEISGQRPRQDPITPTRVPVRELHQMRRPEPKTRPREYEQGWGGSAHYRMRKHGKRSVRLSRTLVSASSSPCQNSI